MARTRAQSITRIRARLADPTAKVWPDDGRLESWLQEAYDTFCYRTNVIFKRAPIADVAGQALYNLPSDFYNLQRCEWNNRAIPPARGYDLSVSDKSFETTQGDVIAFMVDGDGTRKLRKIRVPAASDATKFQIEYYARGTVLSTAASEFDVPDWMVNIVERRALSLAFDSEGPGQSLDLAEMYGTEFERGVQRVISRRQKMHKSHTPVIGGGTRMPVIGRPVLPPNYGRPARF